MIGYAGNCNMLCQQDSVCTNNTNPKACLNWILLDERLAHTRKSK